MTTVANRTAVHAYISPEAHGGLEGYTTEIGVSLTSLLEVIGTRLANRPPDSVFRVEFAAAATDDLAKECRRVDAERRRRSRS